MESCSKQNKEFSHFFNIQMSFKIVFYALLVCDLFYSFIYLFSKRVYVDLYFVPILVEN